MLSLKEIGFKKKKFFWVPVLMLSTPAGYMMHKYQPDWSIEQ